jgi:light-harvesting complex I chlorophyll a/b binding protein 1
MRLLTIFAFLFSCTNALSNNVKPVIRGPTAPFENLKLFDQNIFAKGLQPSFLREAELKHSRLAMVAAILLPFSEQFSENPGINFFQENPQFTEAGLFFMFISEFSSMIRGWENPLVKTFALKEDYQPGDFELRLGVNESSMNEQMDKELNNGRLAMIGILGMMVQEVVTQEQLFSHIF